MKSIKKKNSKTTRSIKITLEQARQWYNSSYVTLKTLALTAFSVEELKPNFDFYYIKSAIPTTRYSITIPTGLEKKFEVLSKLEIIAQYCNKSWKKNSDNNGYFISKSTNQGVLVKSLGEYSIFKHTVVNYSEIIYFQHMEDAIEAAKILGEELKYL